ncbi:MAG: restriction endonuclease subunit S [Candidatus Thermoplasmatota archaeon]
MKQQIEKKFKETEIGMIPEDWDKLPLSEAVTINPHRYIKKGEKCKFISMDMLKEHNRKIQGFEIRNYSGGTKFINGDTLLARITPCLENGKTAFVDILFQDEVAAGSTEFIILCGKENKTTNKFVYYLSISPQMKAEAIKSMTGTSGRQRVQASLLKTVSVLIPPLTEQQSIAKILSDLDSKIELNQQMNNTLEAIGQALFKHWFVDFEFPNEEGKPYKSSGGEMVYAEEVGKEIPKGWKVGTINDLAIQIKDQVLPYKYPEKIYNHLSIEAYDSGKKPLKQFGSEIQSNKFKVHDKTILFSKLNPRFQRIWPITDAKENSICSTEFLVFKPKDNSFSYFYNLLLSNFIREKLIQMARGTSSSHQRISAGDILNLSIVVPPQDILESFERLILPSFIKRQQNIENQLVLSKIRDSLLPKLMSGKIRVQLPETEAHP